ncbi:MAG: adenylate/guanylate cyclase domain-containing protein [Rhodospirillaceae bacterium]|nr:adenylate/guanylate cyclase domain-containing protein [Rhodospirillaceae bacterium]MBT7029846.1 adenylate/guanylate cyclase domain-containing protein [Rhodospirillaceae bacterium]
MADREVKRRLAAILAADVAGYTRLMESDSEGTVAAWQDAREDVIKPSVAEYSGTIVKLTGDGFLVEFPTVQDAVNCAIAMQSGLVSSSLDFRFGINLGDIIDDGEDIHGEGVNVAARLEGLAKPGGICISGDVFNQVKNRIEATFEDMGAQEVKNVSGPVQAYAISFSGSSTGSKTIEHLVASKPSIAVLPFDNLSGDPEQEYFSDGISEDIITALSRIRQFFVIARNTTFTYKGLAVDVQAIASELGVRYVLEGSVRKSGNRVRITGQLIDGGSGNHIWAEKYDRELEDVFAVQDEITQTVVGAIGPELDRAERERALLIPPESLDAWDFYQRGLWHIYRFTRDDNFKAEELFRKSVSAHSRFAPAHAGISFAKFNKVFMGESDDRQRDIAEAFKAGQSAVNCDDKDPFAHWVLARALLLREEFDRAIAGFETAIHLNPSFAHGYYMLGWALMLTGKNDAALRNLNIALRLSPHDPIAFGMMGICAITNLLSGEMNLAVDWIERGLRQTNAHKVIYVVAALVGAMADRDDLMKIGSEYISRHAPDYSCAEFLHALAIQPGADRQLLLDGLRKAGLPDG